MVYFILVSSKPEQPLHTYQSHHVLRRTDSCRYILNNTTRNQNWYSIFGICIAPKHCIANLAIKTLLEVLLCILTCPNKCISYVMKRSEDPPSLFHAMCLRPMNEHCFECFHDIIVQIHRTLSEYLSQRQQFLFTVPGPFPGANVIKSNTYVGKFLISNVMYKDVVEAWKNYSSIAAENLTNAYFALV